MKARDIMTFPVGTVRPDFSIEEVARIFVQRRISGAPVMTDEGKLVGMITERDLMYRDELGTQHPHPYWYLEYAGKDHLAAEYVKARAKRVADVMTPNAITATSESSLNEIAALLENNAIKRVPIVENGELVGIVSRANLVQALASMPPHVDVAPSDAALRSLLLRHLADQPWADISRISVIVQNGLVELWGSVNTETQKQAVRVAAESISGVASVTDHLRIEFRESPRSTDQRATR